MQVITIYAAHGDGGNEHHQGPIISYHRTQVAADEAAHGRGWYGGNGGTTSHPALVIDGKYWVLRSPKPIDIDLEQAKADDVLRTKVLAKLSPTERRVLGLGDGK